MFYPYFILEYTSIVTMPLCGVKFVVKLDNDFDESGFCHWSKMYLYIKFEEKYRCYIYN